MPSWLFKKKIILCSKPDDVTRFDGTGMLEKFYKVNAFKS
jgi:hypothetical protein